MGAAPHRVALSFDDGPDPEWTPKILDILKQKQAPACFFVIGEAANLNTGIVKREYAQGNEIGNHTFTHPEFETISKSTLQLEVNFTELLLEGSLGVKTLFFRPPYGIDHQPETASEIQMLPVPQAMGYVIIGARVDPHDWGEVNGGAPPPTDTIVERVLADATANKGNIILLHDGGGDRSHTVAALPQIIDGLRARGYEFVSVSSLLGQSRADLMPPLSHQEWLLARADAFIFDLFRWFRTGIAFIFMAGILLVSGRALVIGVLALIEKLRPSPEEHPDYKPSVTVLIPAYNEESVILDTIRSAIASDYPKLEILVIDDGSTDRTAELVRANFGSDPRVRLLLQANGGKPSALNHGLSETTGEIIVSIDADTIVDPEAIPRLVRHFADARVGAVAGNVKVMNRNRWITRWQALEYITSQNLEKRAFDLLNCIPVVPGAAGAWRADLLRSSGGFSGDTVAEDTDLTLTIRRNGWKILYDEDAIGRTEVPETVEALIRQRFRWTFGTLASRVETSRHGRQTALRHARMDRGPQHFHVSNCAAARFSRHRFALFAFARAVGAWPAAHRESAPALVIAGRRTFADFFRALHADRSVHVRGRLRTRAPRGLDASCSVDSPAFLLSSDDVRGTFPRAQGSCAGPASRLARGRTTIACACRSILILPPQKWW